MIVKCNGCGTSNRVTSADAARANAGTEKVNCGKCKHSLFDDVVPDAQPVPDTPVPNTRPAVPPPTFDRWLRRIFKVMGLFLLFSILLTVWGKELRPLATAGDRWIAGWVRPGPRWRPAPKEQEKAVRELLATPEWRAGAACSGAIEASRTSRQQRHEIELNQPNLSPEQRHKIRLRHQQEWYQEDAKVCADAERQVQREMQREASSAVELGKYQQSCKDLLGASFDPGNPDDYARCNQRLDQKNQLDRIERNQEQLRRRQMQQEWDQQSRDRDQRKSQRSQ